MVSIIAMRTCCFLGNRTILETDDLKTNLRNTIEGLIIQESVDTFLFGSKSRFNSLCWELVTELQGKYSHIKRVYVRAEFPIISDNYKAYLLEYYEDSYYPNKIRGSGKAVYVERNYEMINNSQFCIVYYDERHTHIPHKSGTKIALDYAIKQNKNIIRFPNQYC